MSKKQPTYEDLLEATNALIMQHKEVRKGNKGIIIKATTLKKILEDAIAYKKLDIKKIDVKEEKDEGTDSKDKH